MQSTKYELGDQYLSHTVKLRVHSNVKFQTDLQLQFADLSSMLIYERTGSGRTDVSHM